MDVEDYYFPQQRASRQAALEGASMPCAGVPFVEAADRLTVQENLLRDARAHAHFVLAGVSMNWCDELLGMIDLAFHVVTPAEERLRRIARREAQRFGARVMPGGDMYAGQKDFHTAVAARTEESVRQSAVGLHCPIITLDGALPVEHNLAVILAAMEDMMQTSV